jgi:hypothetical protein
LAGRTSRQGASKLELALNGNLLKGVTAQGREAGSKDLSFILARTVENRDKWNLLLSKSHFTKTSDEMTVGVSPDGGATLFGAKDTPRIGFIVVPEWYWILRDPAPDLGANKLGSYSLARSQMAWWLFILLGSYAYIFAITQDIDTVTQGVLVLMGISVSAGLGSLVVDSSKQTQRKALESERASLTTDISNLTNQLAAAADPNLAATLGQKQARIAAIADALKALPLPTGESQGFLMDILSDDAGVNFHRFQMFAWTLVLGIIFVYQVWSNLAMPDFSATLLGLMGISSGTYLGFKIPDSPK